MKKYINTLIDTALFAGINKNDIEPMLQCLSYSVSSFKKGDFIILEEDTVLNIGIILEGSIDMIKEDFWGNKTTLVRIKSGELFGETFACSKDSTSTVSFCATCNTAVLFMPFNRVMHSCNMACGFHHRLIENMVFIIAEKNKELMLKVEVVSKKTLREKIMAYLSIHAAKQRTEYFEVPLGRVEMADYLCADRSALTRELTNMQNEGIIDFDRNTFRLL